MLQHKELLHKRKNLLAFSGGVDSSALFFLLLEHHISFDIAIVDYGVRESSKEEVAFAKELAKEHNLTCHTLKAPPIKSNFEANAREIRYSFFERLITQYSYNNLITAHHLGDRFEWMLMQLCRGAGAVELAGMQGVEQRGSYTLIRPLLVCDKNELLAYLKHNKLHYFVDESNADEKYKRNYFRKHFTEPLLAEYKDGIAKSFVYLDADRELLVSDSKIERCNDFIYFSSHSLRSDIATLDKFLKTQGKVLTSHERELLQMQECVVVGREYVLSWWRGFVLLTPYVQTQKITKEFKEKMRKLKLPPKMRSYFASDVEAFEVLESLAFA